MAHTTLTPEQVAQRRAEGRDQYLRLVDVWNADGQLTSQEQQDKANFERYLQDLRAADFQYRAERGQIVPGINADQSGNPFPQVEQRPAPAPAAPADPLPGFESQPRDFFSESRSLYPWLPEEVVRIYAGHFAQSRDSNVAWAKTRESAEYKRFFDGIFREDGTLRMSEIEYVETKASYRVALRREGVNPDVFESRFVDLIKGDVSAREFQQRIDVVRERVLENIGQVAEEFGDQFGLAGRTHAELIAAGLDPNVGVQVLEGRITRAQISAEAKVRGFQRSAARVDELARFGVTQETARSFYGTLAERFPALQASAGRFNEGGFAVEDVEAAGIFGDPLQRQRLERLGARVEASTSPQAGVRRNREGGLTGLERR